MDERLDGQHRGSSTTSSGECTVSVEDHVVELLQALIGAGWRPPDGSFADAVVHLEQAFADDARWRAESTADTILDGMVADAAPSVNEELSVLRARRVHTKEAIEATHARSVVAAQESVRLLAEAAAWQTASRKRAAGGGQRSEPADGDSASVERVAELEREVAQLRVALARRAPIGQLLGMIMVVLTCSAESAWSVLVTMSQHSNQRVHDIATLITGQVATGELQSTELRAVLSRFQFERGHHGRR